MKILLIHANWIEWRATKKAIKNPEEADKQITRVDEPIVVFMAVEKQDEKDQDSVVKKTVEQILDVRENVKADKVVLYPYAHLSSDLGHPDIALSIMRKTEELIQKKKVEVWRAPFGWYKAFNLSAKGHPLSELSREINTDDSLGKKRGGTQDKKKSKERSATQIQEYKEHDHRRIGQDLDLYSFHDEAPGVPFYHNNGLIIINELIDFWRQEHKIAGYQEVNTPQILNKELWETSGHWIHYAEGMYKLKDEDMALKPMNCPAAMLLFKMRKRSYKELPIRMAELGKVHRSELSGVLSGLFRVRGFTQDDAHIFVGEDEIEDEVVRVLELLDKIYSPFGFEYRMELSTKPKNAIGSKEIWDRAEKSLANALKKKKCKYRVNKGDGAFYGPKIDFHIKDSLGRSWQCGTVQCDFNFPQRFDLKYVGEDGQNHRPVVIHRALFGSIDRFLGVIIEHYKGNLPIWLAPVQMAVLPITDRNLKTAKKAQEELLSKGFRSTLEDDSDTLPSKIKKAQLQKIPYMLIIGDKEEKEKVVMVRHRSGMQEKMTLEKFILSSQKEVRDKVQV